jgi:2-iminobutanoate/2-iminopropanoate deaminase
MIERLGLKPASGGGSQLPIAPAVRAGDFVFVSGQVGFDASGALVAGGITQQAEQTIANIVAILATANCTLADVVKVGVWLDDARDFGPFNQVFARHFGANPPARSTVQSSLVIDAKVEIDVIAYKP